MDTEFTGGSGGCRRKMERRGVGAWGCRSVGALERWSVGALERWSVGALERWSVGAPCADGNAPNYDLPARVSTPYSELYDRGYPATLRSSSI